MPLNMALTCPLLLHAIVQISMLRPLNIVLINMPQLLSMVLINLPLLISWVSLSRSIPGATILTLSLVPLHLSLMALIRMVIAWPKILLAVVSLYLSLVCLRVSPFQNLNNLTFSFPENALSKCVFCFVSAWYSPCHSDQLPYLM